MMDILASLNLVRRTRSVPNTITVIGVRKALLIGQLVFIVTHYHETPLVWILTSKVQKYPKFCEPNRPSSYTFFFTGLLSKAEDPKDSEYVPVKEKFPESRVGTTRSLSSSDMLTPSPQSRYYYQISEIYIVICTYVLCTYDPYHN